MLLETRLRRKEKTPSMEYGAIDLHKRKARFGS